MSDRDKRILQIGVPVILLILIVRFVFLSDNTTKVVKPVVSTRSAVLAEKELDKYRKTAATVPAKETLLAQVDAELATREKGVLVAETAPQAQARLFEIAKKVSKAEGIDIRGGELGQVRALGADYGEATASVSFECRIEQFINFMAGISHEPELLAPSDIRVTTANQKEKPSASA